MSYDPGIATGAMVWFAVYENGTHVIVHAEETQNLNMYNKAELIKQVELKLGSKAYARTSGHDVRARNKVTGITFQEEWGKLGIYFSQCVKSTIPEGLEKINNMIYMGKLGVVDNLEIVKSALYNYTYDVKKHKRDERWSHIIDAIRYGILSNWVYVRTGTYKEIYRADFWEFNEKSGMYRGKRNKYKIDWGNSIIASVNRRISVRRRRRRI